MVEFLQVYLPIIIYILLIVVLIIAIIIGVKISNLLDKVNHVTDSVSDKIDSLNGIFHVIDFATDRVNEVATRVVDFLSANVSKFINRKSKKDKIEKEEDLWVKKVDLENSL